MEHRMDDGYNAPLEQPPSPLPQKLSDMIGLVISNNDSAPLDLAALNELAAMSYDDGPCDGITLAFTRCLDPNNSSCIVAKTLTALGYLILIGSEKLVEGISRNCHAIRFYEEFPGRGPAEGTDTASFIREKADALMRLLSGDQSLLRVARRGVSLAASHILGAKDSRACFSVVMAGPSASQGDSATGAHDDHTTFASLDITSQISNVSAMLRASMMSEIYQGSRDECGVSTKVAIKVVIRDPKLARRKDLQRHRAEITIWKNLQHDNILPLCGLYWMPRGVPALVSPWCDNGDINQYIKTRAREDCNDIIDGLKLELFHQVLQGLEYLHQERIIHGDIKGANVLISDNGVARLCDFGLAFMRDNADSLSSTSRVPGTTRWMAPELIKGTRMIYADIWAFGCLVLEVQSGCKPFDKIDREELVTAELNKNNCPSRPKNFPDRLWWLALQTWQIAYAGRPSARALSARMTALIDIYKSDADTWRQIAIPEPHEIPLAVIERILGDDLGHRKALKHQLRPISLQAMYVLFSTDPGRRYLNEKLAQTSKYACVILQICIEGANKPAGRSRLFGLLVHAAMRYARQLEGPLEVNFHEALISHPRPGHAVSPLLRLLSKEHAEAYDQAIHDWVKQSFPNALKLPKIQGHESTVKSVVYTVDGEKIVSGSQDHSLRIWDARTGALAMTLSGHVAGITCIAVSTASHEVRIASGSSDGTVRLWNLAEGRDIAGPLKQNESSITSVAISPDGSRVASSSGDGTVSMWEAPSGRQIGRPDRDSRTVEQLAFSSDGMRLAVFSTTRTHYALSTRKSSTGRGTDCASRHALPWSNDVRLTASALSSDWARAALGFSNGEVGVLEIESASFVRYAHGWHPVRHISVEAVAFSPDDSRVASSCNGSLQIRDLNKGRFIGPSICLSTDSQAPSAMAFHPKGWTIATGSQDKCIRVWDATASWKFFSKRKELLPASKAVAHEEARFL